MSSSGKQNTGIGQEAPSYSERLDRQARVLLEWRFSQLEKAGYSLLDAALLAGNLNIDLHEACDLVGLGCPPEIAIEILT